MRSPQVAGANVCGKKPVVQGIQIGRRGTVKAAAERRDIIWKLGRVYRNQNIIGNGWSAARIADPPQN